MNPSLFLDYETTFDEALAIGIALSNEFSPSKGPEYASALEAILDTVLERERLLVCLPPPKYSTCSRLPASIDGFSEAQLIKLCRSSHASRCVGIVSTNCSWIGVVFSQITVFRSSLRASRRGISRSDHARDTKD